jgi:hypothetical protein
MFRVFVKYKSDKKRVLKESKSKHINNELNLSKHFHWY